MKKFISVAFAFAFIALSLFSFCVADVIDPVLNDDGIAEHLVEEEQEDMGFSDIGIEDTENVFYSYVVAENKMGSLFPVYGDKDLKEQIYDITKEGANILFYDNENNHIYHITFVDQNGNVLTGYVDLFGKDFTKLTEAEAATMSSLGAIEKKVNGMKTILFPTEIKVFVKETATPTLTPRPTQKPRATKEPVANQNPQPHSDNSTSNAGETGIPENTTQGQASTVQTNNEQITNSPESPEKETKNPDKNSQSLGSETKTVSIPTEEELRALGYTEPVDYSLYYLIGGGALAVVLIIVIIAVIVKKHRKPKRSLL